MKDSILWTWVSLWPIGDYLALAARRSRNPFASLSPEHWEFPRKEESVMIFLTTYCGLSLHTVHLNVVSPGILQYLRDNCPNIKKLSFLPPSGLSFSTPLPSFTMAMGNEQCDMSFISQSITHIQLTFHGRQILKKKKKVKSKWAKVSILNVAEMWRTNLFIHLSQCSNLRHVSLYHCCGISVSNIAQLTKGIPNLETLHLMHFDYDSDENVLEDILQLIGNNLTVLQSLRFMPMIRRTACIDHFLGIVRNRKSMKCLWLPGPMLSFTQPAFAEMARGLMHLHELALCQSSSVNNTILKLISNHMLTLQILNLRGCNAVTDDGVRYLTHNHTLRFVDFRECKRISTEAVLDTVMSMAEIVHVDVSSHFNKKREFLVRLEDMKRVKPFLKVAIDFTYTESEK